VVASGTNLHAKGTIGPLLAAVLLLACKREGPETLHVLAAASLTDVLPKVGESFTADDGMKVEYVFDATSRLATQIASGAPADVFFAADREWMTELEEKDERGDGDREPWEPSRGARGRDGRGGIGHPERAGGRRGQGAEENAGDNPPTPPDGPRHATHRRRHPTRGLRQPTSSLRHVCVHSRDLERPEKDDTLTQRSAPAVERTDSPGNNPPTRRCSSRRSIACVRRHATSSGVTTRS
jgi:hypothetical protein